MTTLKQLIADDAVAGGVFLPTDSSGDPVGFNEEVTFYPAYSSAGKSTENVHVIRDDLEGTREVRGDGVTFNRDEGRRTRRSIRIVCRADLNVRDKQPTLNPDAFKVDGQMWVVKRILGEDAGLQDVLCVHQDDSTIRTESRTG